MLPPKILFIPHAEEDGTSDRTPSLLRLLRMRHDVVTLPSPWDRFIFNTSRAKAPRYALYAVDRFLAVVRGVRLGKRAKIQLTFCETAHHALVGLWISRLLVVPCVWDSHGNAGIGARSLGKGRGYTVLATSLDRFLGHRVDAVITVSKADAEAYETMGVPASRLHVIPTSVYMEQVNRDAGQEDSEEASGNGHKGRPTLLFFGSFKYAPNREALEFISATLAPFLERAGILCQIVVAGRDIPDIELHPWIKPVGFVPDIYALIRRADLCIVPIWSGVGILTKVIDTMAVGTPMVMSSQATMGIPEIQDGIHALIAGSPSAFCDLVAAALREPDRMHQVAKRAQRLAEERYDWSVQEPLLEAVLSGLIGNRGGTPVDGR